MKTLKEFKIPVDIPSIIAKHGYWEDDSFVPFTITIEEVQYKGKDMMSYQVQFEPFEEYETIRNGIEWEEIIIEYIKKKDPELLQNLFGDSESSATVIWTNDETHFLKILNRIDELLKNPKEVKILHSEILKRKNNFI